MMSSAKQQEEDRHSILTGSGEWCHWEEEGGLGLELRSEDLEDL
ncbi:unnamed protein product [Arabidopsis arenosa]|uniref:Uncharacterized protein n=1 Tax=Arabidopsis arenosa TaxID=38785 RepID=A0A8S2APC2_ARAAE|nr:unnamed protein product [Arabidopsis arenosa]